MPNVPCLDSAKYKAAAVRLVGLIAIILHIAQLQDPKFLSPWIELNISTQKMIENPKFTIGESTISIKDSSQRVGYDIPPAYHPFIGSGKSDISLRLHPAEFAPAAETKVFESPPIWSLYRKNGASILRLFEQMPGYGRTLVLPRNAEKTDLYFDDPHGRFTTPFYGPTMELLMVHYLAAGRGIIIHGCGIRRGKKGILFAGESGAGKTTMARIWSRQTDAEILSDDRTIVRKKDGHFWIYGTPWHGEGKFGSPGSVKLDRVFFIKHGEKNSIKSRNNVFSVTQFLNCSFPPLWDAKAMNYSMELFSDLAESVPCRELSFKPDRSVIDFIKAQGLGQT